jgi:hypothetical protein
VYWYAYIDIYIYFAELRSFRRGYRALRLCEDIV